MCVSMGLMSEPCCANLDCETQPFILQSGFAHRHHPSGANRLRQAGSYNTGWTCPPARETAAEIAYKLSPCKPLRLRYARGLTAHRLAPPAASKKTRTMRRKRGCCLQALSLQATSTAPCREARSSPHQHAKPPPATRRRAGRLQCDAMCADCFNPPPEALWCPGQPDLRPAPPDPKRL